MLSILEWASNPELMLDEEQILAFQVIMSSFVLTHFDDATSQPPGTRVDDNGSARATLRHAFVTERRRLQDMTRIRGGGP